MPSEDTTRYVDNAAAVLGLEISPEWMPNVLQFFDVAKDMAALVIDSGALTEREAAPVFTPRGAE